MLRRRTENSSCAKNSAFLTGDGAKTMCLIVDINVAHRILLVEVDEQYGHVRKCLDRNLARIVYGGELNREYQRSESIRRIIVAYDRAGKARKIDDKLVDNETEVIQELALCRSNDVHIIALARVANVRLLCSADQALHEDFRNKALIDKPRGSVYQDESHKHLLRQHCANR